MDTGKKKPTWVKTIKPTWSPSFKETPFVVAVLTLIRDNQKKLKDFFDRVSKADPWPGRFAKAVRSGQEVVLTKLKEVREKRCTSRSHFR
jgi:hypothetical protein